MASLSFCVFALLLAGALAKPGLKSFSCPYGIQFKEEDKPAICLGSGCDAGYTCQLICPFFGFCCADATPCPTGDPPKTVFDIAVPCFDDLSGYVMCGPYHSCDLTYNVCCPTTKDEENQNGEYMLTFSSDKEKRLSVGG